MMENKSDKGGFWKRQSFLLPPLTAAVVLLCQQMGSSNPSGVVTVNILLLVLNFFSYVGLLRGEKKHRKIRGDRRGRFYYTDGICVQYLRSGNSHPFERYGNLYEQSLRYVGTGSSCSRNFAVDTGSVATNG